MIRFTRKRIITALYTALEEAEQKDLAEEKQRGGGIYYIEDPIAITMLAEFRNGIIETIKLLDNLETED